MINYEYNLSLSKSIRGQVSQKKTIKPLFKNTVGKVGDYLKSFHIRIPGMLSSLFLSVAFEPQCPTQTYLGRTLRFK